MEIISAEQWNKDQHMMTSSGTMETREIEKSRAVYYLRPQNGTFKMKLS